jgi:hypothetical protein
MDRRELLRRGGLTLAASACPMWLATAFAREVRAPRKPHVFVLALVRAKEMGKPLLVFAVPDGLEAMRRRSMLAALLRCRSDDLLATLALVEVVCARSEEVAGLDSSIDKTAIAFVVEQKPQLRVVGVSVALEAAPELGLVDDEVEADANRRWLSPLIARLREAIVGDAQQLERLRAVNEAQLDWVMRSTVHRDLRTARMPDLARADRCAAQYFSEAQSSSSARELWEPLLVRAASARLLDHAPAGAQWVDSGGGGCGFGPCGTAAVSPRSRRFLEFLTASE